MNKFEQYVDIVEEIDTLEDKRIQLREELVEQMKNDRKYMIRTEKANLHLTAKQNWLYPRQLLTIKKEMREKGQAMAKLGYILLVKEKEWKKRQKNENFENIINNLD